MPVVLIEYTAIPDVKLGVSTALATAVNAFVNAIGKLWVAPPVPGSLPVFPHWITKCSLIPTFLSLSNHAYVTHVQH